jgi:acyl-CoA reductase-like NAD-dependent aldehyde dehydrogenase
MDKTEQPSIIGGWWSSSDPSHHFDVEEPATGKVIARVQGAGAEEMDEAVIRSHRAFSSSWRHLPPRERARFMRLAGERLREHADEIATLESREVGKPYEISRYTDMFICAEAFDYFAGLADKLHGSFYSGGPIDSYTLLEPYGVVGAIVPFNWPPIHTGSKIAPAIAAGNTVVLKPPEQSPLCVMRIVEVLQEVLPTDVVQAVPGTGAGAGNALASHPLVRRISFTGSPETARHILRAAAENFTGALLELGGKNPILVFADADLDLAVPAAVEGSFFNQGEACTAASRLLVHESIAQSFVERYLALVSKLVVGDPLAPGTHIGPLVTRAQQQRVLDYIALGPEEGATLAYQGSLPDDPRLSGGFFVAPVVFTDVTSDMRIAQEEIFGPVAAIMRFADYEEAVRIANGTRFALVAGVFSGDPVLCSRAARDLDAGMVFINNYNRMLFGTPFGGNRASGYGRELFEGTLHEYLSIKTVRSPSGKIPVPVWSGVAPR